LYHQQRLDAEYDGDGDADSCLIEDLKKRKSRNFDYVDVVDSDIEKIDHDRLANIGSIVNLSGLTKMPENEVSCIENEHLAGKNGYSSGSNNTPRQRRMWQSLSKGTSRYIPGWKTLQYSHNNGELSYSWWSRDRSKSCEPTQLERVKRRRSSSVSDICDMSIGRVGLENTLLAKESSVSWASEMIDDFRRPDSTNSKTLIHGHGFMEDGDICHDGQLVKVSCSELELDAQIMAPSGSEYFVVDDNDDNDECDDDECDDDECDDDDDDDDDADYVRDFNVQNEQLEFSNNLRSSTVRLSSPTVHSSRSGAGPENIDDPEEFQVVVLSDMWIPDYSKNAS